MWSYKNNTLKCNLNKIVGFYGPFFILPYNLQIEELKLRISNSLISATKSLLTCLFELSIAVFSAAPSTDLTRWSDQVKIFIKNVYKKLFYFSYKNEVDFLLYKSLIHLTVNKNTINININDKFNFFWN